MLKYSSSEIVTAVSFGTSKICAIIGEADDSGNVIVLGHGVRDSEDSVCKGEIVDMEKAAFLFREALSDAEETAGVEVVPGNIYLGITGGHIRSYQGLGSIPITTQEKVITEEHINKALENARVTSHSSDEAVIDTIGGHFVIDNQHISDNPLGQVAFKLEVHSHIICGNRNRIENFTTILRDEGLDNPIPVFSGLGSAYSIVSDEEHKKGVLFIDMGAGTTEYLLFYNPGVLHSGTLTVGCDHIANDLSIGLDLGFSPTCRDLLVSYAKNPDAYDSVIPIKLNLGTRKIPVQTVNKIIDMRLRETFEIIRKELEELDYLKGIGAGIVFTGGAAMIPQAEDVLREVFKLPVRTVGMTMPDNFGGAVSDLESPRYSDLLGLLQFGLVNSRDSSFISKIDRNITAMLKSSVKKVLKSFKL